MKKMLYLFVILIVLGSVYYRIRPKVNQTERPVSSPVEVSYLCKDNKSIEASFIVGTTTVSSDSNLPPVSTGKVTLRLSDGRTMTLPQTVSASGVRYANADESFVFWNKGNGALILENNVEKSYIGCVQISSVPTGSPLTEKYANSQEGFSIRYPRGYTIEESFKNQIAPNKIISGVRFIIPKSLSSGTNLASDSYLSVESIPRTPDCTADLFFDGVHETVNVTDNNATYSVATSSGAGAGNRYEETVYALPGTNPCMAIRYLVHYGVIENYPEGTVKEFNKQMILGQFDQIRRTLLLVQ